MQYNFSNTKIYFKLLNVITRRLNLVFIQKDASLEVRAQSMISKVYTLIINLCKASIYFLCSGRNTVYFSFNILCFLHA